MVAALTVLASGVLSASPAAAAPGSVAPAPAAPVKAAALQPAHPAAPASTKMPDLGPNVYVFTPSMSQDDIQATVDAIADQQVGNQFGTQRYALLFEPGSYGTVDKPLIFQVGYYTQVAGLGRNPGDVTINGSIDVYNQCFAADNCIALDNFWRSLSNLTINVTGQSGCRGNTEFWAVSQAAPMRRVQVNGNSSLMDYCTAGPQYASGGFIADSSFSGGVVNGSQQQFLVRNSVLNGWSNGVWNQVFSGVTNAPPQSFGSDANQYTTLASSPVTREEPFLADDGHGGLQVIVPGLQHNSSGTSWTAPAAALPLTRFFVATPATSVTAINLALITGKNLLLTPGVYSLRESILALRPDTIVLGLGFPTLIPQNGTPALVVGPVAGAKISGLIIDAGPRNSPVLMQVGLIPGLDLGNRADDPTLIQDVFFRIGGATAGKATTSLVVNNSNVILDDIWAWRADHGTGVGWSTNTADTGLVVGGNNVTAYGLFVEHFQKANVIWNGQNGTDIFFQNELPYDPPSQAAWRASSTFNGYPAFQIGSRVRTFAGYGMGSYSFFNQDVDIHATSAFVTPTNSGIKLHDLLTVFLDGSGSIDHVVNATGSAANAADQGKPQNVVSYP